MADEFALAVAFVNKLCWFESHYRYIFMYARQMNVRWQFVNKLCWFESHYRHIFM